MTNQPLINAGCSGLCVRAYEIGLPEYGAQIAIAHPDCPVHSHLAVGGDHPGDPFPQQQIHEVGQQGGADPGVPGDAQTLAGGGSGGDDRKDDQDNGGDDEDAEAHGSSLPSPERPDPSSDCDIMSSMENTPDADMPSYVVTLAKASPAYWEDWANPSLIGGNLTRMGEPALVLYTIRNGIEGRSDAQYIADRLASGLHWAKAVTTGAELHELLSDWQS